MTRLRVVLAFVASLALAATACTARRDDTFTLSLVGTNDLHGGILETDGRGGLALLDGYVTNLRAARQRDKGAVLLVDAGDLFQGTLESNLNEGAVVIDAYNAIGYQAATIGNHEFDYGPQGPSATPRAPADDPRGALKARLAQARFPFVAANVIEKSTGAPIAYPNTSPTVMLTVGGVKVGIVGLLTQPALTLASAPNVAGLDVAPLADTLTAEATRLRQQGATMVVALAHAGGSCQREDDPNDLSSCRADSEIFQLARRLPAGLVDAIVSGHLHDAIAHEVNGVPIIESWSRGRAFGRIDFTIDRRRGRPESHRIYPTQDLCERVVPGRTGCAAPGAAGAQPAVYEGAPVVASERIAGILEPAVQAAAALKAQPLNATVTTRLPFNDSGQSPVGELEAEWMLDTDPRADAALTNSGGLRADLRPGPFTYGGLYAVLPFDNQRATISLTGAELKTVIADNMKRTGSMVVLAGIKAAAACRGDDVTVQLTRNSGRTVRDNERLRIITTDFLATGGDSFLTRVMPVHVIDQSSATLRDELAQVIARSHATWGAERLTRAPHVLVPAGRPLSCSRR